MAVHQGDGVFRRLVDGVVELVLLAEEAVTEGPFADAHGTAHWGLAVCGNGIRVRAACRVLHYCFDVAASAEGFVSSAAQDNRRNCRVFRPFLNKASVEQLRAKDVKKTQVKRAPEVWEELLESLED